MSETAPAAPVEPVVVPMGKPSTKRRGKKPGGLTGASRKPPVPSVSQLITEAVSMCQDRAGMSLAALKKALAAAGYDVEKNNSRIKLGLKSLVSKGTLVQTKGTGASGSFRLSKKATPEPTKNKVKKSRSRKTKKGILSRDSRSPKSIKTNKKVKQQKNTVKKAVRGGRPVKGAQGRKQSRSPARGRPAKPKPSKTKLPQQKAGQRKLSTKK
ncbi:histone H1t [Ochotona princeps]|uniref:histone H1t n=1 Tax=Ochotona princeps TaxID=9978 RepID=UPI002714CB89|nr:histone H1t [Ochotona princeps]